MKWSNDYPIRCCEASTGVRPIVLVGENPLNGSATRPKKDDDIVYSLINIGKPRVERNIIFRVKEGVNREENDPYHYLFKLACRVAAKRMNPTFMNIDADFNKEYYDKGYMPATMGCRTYLMSNRNGEPGCKGRGNIAPTTINLPRLGIFAKHDIEKFFELLDSKLEIAKESLLHRYSILKNLRVKDLPFVAGQGLMKGAEGLTPDDSIEAILKQGSYGY